MGAWDHFYPDSTFSPSASTHYVNLPHWLPLSWDEVARLKLPTGVQHSAWQWLPLADAAHPSSTLCAAKSPRFPIETRT